MRILFILVIFLLPQLSLACFAPRGGAEYDQLIQIEKLDEKNRYKITVPKILEDLEEAEIMLAYSQDYPGGVPIYESYDVLNYKESDETVSAIFTVEKKEQRQPYIVVMWWPKICCLCGIQANSGYLAVE